MKDLGMDSLDAVEVVMAFEDEFGKFRQLPTAPRGWMNNVCLFVVCLLFVYWLLLAVEISDEEAEKIFSCKDAVELLKSKLDIH